MNINEKKIIAIMGPSGVGKTTLGDKLVENNKVVIPRHCTTRLPRKDDGNGFYRYLTHEEYDKYLKQGKFLISSGDGPEVKKEYGNFYGILIQDLVDAWSVNSIVVIFVSYKDIYTLMSLKETGLDINIVNLTFTNIEKGMTDRLNNNPLRNQTATDVNNRIKSALSDYERYGNIVNSQAQTSIYTDILGIEETYKKVCYDLGLVCNFNITSK